MAVIVVAHASDIPGSPTDGDVYVTADGFLGPNPQGGAPTVQERIGVISNFASPNAGGFVVGQYYDNSFQGPASGTLAGVAGRLDLAPYFTSQRITIDQIGVAVSTAVAGATGRVCIYESDADGWPSGNPVYEGGADLSFAATGYVFHTLGFTFETGTPYWLGIKQSSTATLRTVAVASAVNLGLTSSSAANYATILRRSVTYANPAPSWTFTNSDRVANVTPPSIRFRVASVG